MESLKKILFLAFVLFVLILFVWALYAPKPDIQATLKETMKSQKNRLDLFYKGVTFQETQDSIKYWEIKAKTSSVNRSTNVASLEGTGGTFFQKGKPVLKFIAPSAIWQMDRQEIRLSKPVGYDAKAPRSAIEKFLSIKQKSPSYFELPADYNGAGKDFFFRAENLLWDMRDKELVCDNGLWIKKGNMSGMAKMLKGDVALEKVRLTGNPRIYITDTYLAVITAEIFEIDSRKDLLKALNGVTMSANEIRVTTRSATYEQDTKLLHLLGNVTATYKNFKASADYGVYNLKTQKIKLINHARLVRGKSVLTGNEATIDVKSRAFSIKGKSRIVVPHEEMEK